MGIPWTSRKGGSSSRCLLRKIEYADRGRTRNSLSCFIVEDLKPQARISIRGCQNDIAIVDKPKVTGRPFNML